ncbi:hypothetical protein A2973_01545 [Candidatus Gottesmanbacteria bacterium RIFCSPLOWO2_01_FULL_49_10]|uniref:Small ribosomal subunit protein bS20 n=1 Tax=Candidatus Gottesmanbacteria bacterium RIFCSPLOWO2_01_FULL_49_10 TaxID=1798396 RepID=A0A1F6AWT9_9BACT|nr:MAG: hypothetical protein A2973_01545 [Candidatus Gottesmanbacteria bacterium RIFCSPLOWO2_01_FULL_49_10]
MPVTKQAEKKRRHDRKAHEKNNLVRETMKGLIKSMRRTPSKKSLGSVFRVIDKAAKKNIIHPNKAARLKSRLTKLLGKK